MPIFPRYDGPPLLPQICGVENLTVAWRRVRSNIRMAWRGRSAGVDAVTIRDFEANWTAQMSQLADELQTGAYRPLPPRQVTIPKRSGGERAIAILAVRDRVAQRAVQQVLEPLFDPLFLDCSYGCRPLVGVPEALARVRRYADQGLAWAADADIASYFDTIDQRILLGMVRQRVDEPALLRLLAQWLAVGAMQHGDALDRAVPETPLQRGGRVLRQLIGGERESAPPPLAPGFPPLPQTDLYGAAAWESPAGDPLGASAWQPRGPGLESHLWTAAMFARPVLAGVQRALPHLQRIGGRRIALAGALAAGAVAATEIAVRAWPASRGTPQGGALSPLLANIYLHPFDLALTSQGLHLVRFVDDFVILCADRVEAERALSLARRQLAMLRLALNEEKTRVVAYAEGLEFLGQALAPRQGGPRLGDGITSFAEAERALKEAAGNARQRMRRKRGGEQR
jgi:RNA-directed DNA polymerase